MDTIMFITEPFSHPFMRYALLIAVLIAAMCGSLGALLVPRGLSMLGDGLAHATLGGVGGALLLGYSVESSVWVAMPFSVLVALGIAWLGRHAKVAGDAALGVFFSLALAMGIAAVHYVSRHGSGIDFESLLFGNILGVQPQDVVIVGVLSILLFLLLLWSVPRIAYAGFYPDLAAMSGISVSLMEYILMAVTAVVTVTAVRAVGVLLVSAYLVIPAVAAKMLTRRLGPMILLGIMIGVAGSVIGLLVSFHYDVPTGAAMTLALGVFFVMAMGIRSVRTTRIPGTA